MENDKYDNIKEIPKINEDRIRQAKALRETAGGLNLHKEQCEQIPDVIVHSKHGIHLTPCYKKFTLICSQTRLHSPVNTSSTSTESQRSGRKTAPSPYLSQSSWVYPPKICNICGKNKIYDKKSRNTTATLITITTDDACQAIKMAAREKNPSMYTEIHELDLVAKEYKYHRSCCVTFTFGFTAGGSSTTLDKNETDSIEITNFEGVKTYISTNVLLLKQVDSIRVLQNIYGGIQHSIRRGKLKGRIMREFPEKLVFLRPSHNVPEVIISKTATLKDQIDTVVDKNIYISRAASYIQEDILNFAKNLPETSWPPTVEELSSEHRKQHESVTNFLTELLKLPQSHEVLNGKHCKRLIHSYAADLVHGVTRGKVITAKHFLLATGLHNITGSRTVNQITYKLGHSLDYETTCEIETAQAKKMQLLEDKVSILPLKPREQNFSVRTYFWVDNFDLQVEKTSGGGSVNTTHLIAFQEEDENSVIVSDNITMDRMRRSRIDADKTPDVNPIIDKKKDPPQLPRADIRPTSLEFLTKYFILLVMRTQNGINSYSNQNDQCIPNFAGRYEFIFISLNPSWIDLFLHTCLVISLFNSKMRPSLVIGSVNFGGIRVSAKDHRKRLR